MMNKISNILASLPILVVSLCYYLACLYPSVSLGQNIDSLQNELEKSSPTDNKRLALYASLSFAYSNIQPDKAIQYGTKGLQYLKGTADAPVSAELFQHISTAYLNKNNYDSAAYFLDKAMQIARTTHNRHIEGVTLRLYGSLRIFQNQLDAAMNYLQRAASIFEKPLNADQLCQVYSKIGSIYRLLSLGDQSLKYYRLAERLAIQTNNKIQLATIYTDISAVYRLQDKPKEVWEPMIQKGLSFAQQAGDLATETRTLIILANAYSNNDEEQKALTIAKTALKKAEQMGNTNLISSCANVLAAIQYYLGDYESAIQTAYKVLQDSTDVNMTKHAYVHLALAHARQGQYDSLEVYINKFMSALQEQYSASYHNSLTQMEIKFDMEKKELKITGLEKQKQLYIGLGIAAVVILLIALAYGFIRYRLAVNRRKLAEQTTKRLEQEKQLVAIQATLDGETAERTRLAKDLHDGLGGMLSAVKLNLPQVKESALIEAVDVHRFQKALHMLDDSIQELRRVAHHMMPETLVRYGLKVSLSDFCAAIPQADFHYYGEEIRLEEKTEIMVYRCIHELVNNAIKHAEATHINVQIVQEPDRLSFVVQDDGKGFDQHKVKEGMGLQNIRQRVDAFRGTLDISSSNQGTEVHIELELKNNKNHDQSCDH